MKKLLVIDACISAGESRTRVLLDAFLEACNGFEVQTINLKNNAVCAFDKDMLLKRNADIAADNFDGEEYNLAKAVKSADVIVLAAPYWDLSFPTVVKAFIEHIMVTNLTFGYTETGVRGLCGATEFVYITTAGGFIGSANFGFDYLAAIFKMLGIKKAHCISAEGLDIAGFDVGGAMAKTCEEVKKAANEL